MSVKAATVDVSKQPPFLKHDPVMQLGEGALYRPSDSTLHYLDIEVGPSSKLFIAHINSTTDELVGNVREKAVQGSRYVTALAFRKDYPGSYLCTTNTGLAYLSEESGQLTHLPNGLGQIIAEDDKDKMRFNDAATDSKGRFYFHSMSRDEGKKAGKLYMFEKGMKGVEDLKVLETGFAIGNGPVIDEERKRFYFNFTEQGIGWVYDYDSETGAISNRRENFNNNTRRPASIADPLTTMLGPGHPDGCTLDSRGNLYQAVFARSCIERFTPSGEHDLTINLPARCPTCPVFGGKNLDKLFVITASEALQPGEAELLGDQGGNVLCISLKEHLPSGAKGIVKHDFVD